MFIDSFYESTSAYHMEVSCQYEMVENSYYSFLGIYIYLIHDRETGKCNVYVLDDDVLDWPNSMRFIVENFKALGLDHALFCYPQYGFNDKNYGF